MVIVEVKRFDFEKFSKFLYLAKLGCTSGYGVSQLKRNLR